MPAPKIREYLWYTVCGMCGPGGPGGGCGIYAFVKDGRFIKVAGMDEPPVNNGAICVGRLDCGMLNQNAAKGSRSVMEAWQTGDQGVIST